MKIYVGNLDSSVTDEMLRGLFAPFGEVGKAAVMRDRRGISKGFAFVEMPAEDAAASAIKALNRTLLLDRTLDIASSAPAFGGPGKAKSRKIPFKR